MTPFMIFVRRRALRLLLVALITAPIFGRPALAQPAASDQDVNAFRARLATFLEGIDQLRLRTGTATGDQQPAAADGAALPPVSSLTDEQLATLMRAYPSDAWFWNAPRTLAATLDQGLQPAVVQSGVVQGAAAAASTGPVAGAAAAAEAACPAGFNYEALWVARDAEMVADIAMEVIPEDFATSPAYIVAAVAWAALKVTLFIVEQKYERWDDCETNKVFGDIDASISSRASQASVDALANKFDVTMSSRASQESVNGVTSTLSSVRDEVQSLVAFATVGGSGGPATLYTGTNFTGTQGTINASDGCLGAFFGNIKSVKVPPGATLILYESCEFQGHSRHYTSNDSNVGDDGLACRSGEPPADSAPAGRTDCDQGGRRQSVREARHVDHRDDRRRPRHRHSNARGRGSPQNRSVGRNHDL